ncbi:MAG: LacI family DNA-binding transcriptional regulator [Devosia sp.]
MSTISKVAHRAGVSRTTVSHVLNHADRVSEPLRLRVQTAIDELGYTPNAQARSLRTGRTNHVAILVPDISPSFYTEQVRAAQMLLQEFGLTLAVFNTDVPGGRYKDKAEAFVRQINASNFDGVIVTEFAMHESREHLQLLKCPVVFIGDTEDEVTPLVAVDNFETCRLVGSYLTRIGHRRIADVTGPRFFRSAMRKSLGFHQGCYDGGLSEGDIVSFEGSYMEPSGIEAAQWLMSIPKSERPTAVFFSSYDMAKSALAEFYDMGMKVPGDIAVAVFGVPGMDHVRPKVTRVVIDFAKAATIAADMLQRAINGSDVKESRVIMSPELVVGATT